MIRKAFLAATALAAFAVAPAGAALTFVESATFNNISIASPSFDLPFNKFNPALGTLVSVELKLEVTTMGSTLSFDNEATVPGSVTLNLGAQIKAKTGVALISDVTVNPAKSGTGSVAADNDTTPNFTGTDAFSIASGVLSDTNSILRNAEPYLTQFTAQGNPHIYYVTISSTRNDSFSTSGIFGQTSSNGGTFSGKVSAIYTYTTVPIPEAGTALFGLGLALFVGSRRPRWRQA